MQDIDTAMVLRFLAKHQGRWPTWWDGNYNMPTVADAMPADTPSALRLAKMRQLIKRGSAVVAIAVVGVTLKSPMQV